MVIKPIIKGVVARSAHPLGCQEAIRRQIAYCQSAPQIQNGPKTALILGASSGFGLASRISLAFGGSEADTLGVSFERGPSEKGVGTAGWYNNIYFKQAAEQCGIKAINLIGDAFSQKLRQQVIETIKTELGGKVDLVVYSLASGIRPKPNTNQFWHSAIKPISSPVHGTSINIEQGELIETTLPPASEQEIHDTIKVMGGEDWSEWIALLNEAGVLAEGSKTVAYSYIGPKATYPIYHHGTLGQAKVDLHNKADAIYLQLQKLGGEAHVAVCKALVTKASVFIPGFSPYILALFKVMKEMGLHEGCIEQTQRLFNSKFYTATREAITDDNRLIRLDDWELRDDVQQAVMTLLSQITPDNFKQIGDYDGYLSDFLQLNGFGFDNIDYQQDISMDFLKNLTP
ncbi:enoyl-ACP reductase FabV [uncultured Photobacterium sp.]|uniref:enoyl-ACP reductase FabV n=1 Tax=uncultured Photobacterium sp. TaxID=173973 RepID=UPI0026041C65|nr:enoyl-ACP reductase FabV [uncultured Photobacterium sp.]